MISNEYGNKNLGEQPRRTGTPGVGAGEAANDFPFEVVYIVHGTRISIPLKAEEAEVLLAKGRGE
jgi:hypothetical protein